MTDISFQGSKLALVCSGLSNADANLLLDFGDEGAPVEFQNVEEVGTSGNLNGTLITWSRYQPIQMDISLIPNSASDVKLRNLFYAQHLGGAGGAAVNQSSVVIKSATLTVPAITTTDEGAVTGSGSSTFTFGPGRMTVGSPGIGSNGEGKMLMRRYHFVFEKGDVNVSSGAALGDNATTPLV